MNSITLQHEFCSLEINEPNMCFKTFKQANLEIEFSATQLLNMDIPNQVEPKLYKF